MNIVIVGEKTGSKADIVSWRQLVSKGRHQGHVVRKFQLLFGRSKLRDNDIAEATQQVTTGMSIV